MIHTIKFCNFIPIQLKILNKLSSMVLTQQQFKEYQNENSLVNNNFSIPENSSTINSQKLPLPLKSYNLAPYVAHSENLKYLLNLGVDLSIFENNSEVANLILKMDYETLLQQILYFKNNLDIKDQIGEIITKCPEILTELEQNINARIFYLKSKLFSQETISIMITKTPKLMTTHIKTLDESIGFIQKLFYLDGKEIREVISRLPKIIFHSRFSLQENLLNFDRFLGFKKDEIKSILLADPRILIAGKTAIQQRFAYLHNTMGLSHEHILLWPTILRTRVSTVKPRHEFLVTINKNQYNRKIENFVSMQALAIGNDVKFCSEVAKVPIELYNDFLKTL